MGPQRRVLRGNKRLFWDKSPFIPLKTATLAKSPTKNRTKMNNLPEHAKTPKSHKIRVFHCFAEKS